MQKKKEGDNTKTKMYNREGEENKGSNQVPNTKTVCPFTNTFFCFTWVSHIYRIEVDKDSKN